MTEISIQKLSFAYEDTPVFKDFSLDFSSGGAIAVIGQNGAGKTTLMKLLNGLLKPDSGQILLNQKSTQKQDVGVLSHTIGYVFQNPNDQIFKNRVLDEVMFGPVNVGQTLKVAEKSARDALDLFSLGDKLDENPYDLSLSDRKQIAIASIIAMDTEVIIMDEPTIGQDARGKKVLGQVVKELSRSGKLVISILHDMDFVATHFERVVVLYEGQILADGGAKEVFSQDQVITRAGLDLPHLAALSRALGRDEIVLRLEDWV